MMEQFFKTDEKYWWTPVLKKKNEKIVTVGRSITIQISGNGILGTKYIYSVPDISQGKHVPRMNLTKNEN